MLYLDTSVLVKIYVEEDGSITIREQVNKARFVATSMIAYVEARAAFARRRREGKLVPADHRRTVRAFDSDWAHYLLVEITDSLIRGAVALAEEHSLRAYDAIHLASATLLRKRTAEAILFASWDAHLGNAARREGLELLS
jgi:uncharacterized protein